MTITHFAPLARAAALAVCTAITADALLASALSAQRVPEPRNVGSTVARASGVIDGTVTDTLLKPVGFAEVKILRTDIRIETNALGRFRFTEVPAGQYLLIVRRIGFRPVSSIIQVGVRDTLRLSFLLEPALQTLDKVVITEERRSLKMLEFEERRRRGVGYFITQEQIEKRNLPVAADYLRLAPSISLAPSPNPSGISDLVAISKREGGSLFGDGALACAMQIVVDGVPMPPRFPLELLPTPREIAGFEIYAGAATVPPQFSGLDRRCGMILVWTRDY
ncbi:MAG: carboxypeptidase regulatory-like domain-containing protein [Gemmatimonadaceae bacterium]